MADLTWGPRRMRRLAMGLGLVALAVVVAAPATYAAGAKTKLVSKGPAGVQGDDDSHEPEASANGRFVVFSSDAENLVATDSNGFEDIFVYDRRKNRTTLVSVKNGGTQGNGDSQDPSISADGRYVVFRSDADNLVNGDNNNALDIFLHDRWKKKTSRVSINSAEKEGNKDSHDASISANGRWIAFNTESDNMVPNDTNSESDVFVRDRKKGKTKRVSVRSNGKQANDRSQDAHISANGRYVTFVSHADNLVKDTNLFEDVFVHDRKSRRTTRVSVRSNGKQANGASWDPVITPTGRFVAFHSEASNLRKNDSGDLDVFVRDRAAKRTSMVSVNSRGKQANEGGQEPTISSNGRWVVFHSDSSNLVKNDTNGENDVFMRDRKTGKTKRISVRTGGGQANFGSDDAWVSGDGRTVVFESDADNLIATDTNNDQDIFARSPVN